MGRMEILSRPGWRGATVGSESVPHRMFFNFSRERIFARTHLTMQPLQGTLDREMALQLRKKDFSSLARLIGRKLTSLALAADQLQVKITGQRDGHFNFFSGETREGKQVVLLELI
ncbi:hypothetical protein HZC35_01975 [Candidatus Saganbacteria bacterium]|nr:hypothetical protein [Candidatus Saganbacteria bacterium]